MGALRAARQRRAAGAPGVVTACIARARDAGALPPWVAGRDAACACTELLPGVSQGTSRQAADVETLAAVFEAQVVSVDLRKKGALGIVGGQRKEGRGDVEGSAALTAAKLRQAEVPKVVQTIDRAMKR
jgi:hypothetical protein